MIFLLIFWSLSSALFGQSVSDQDRGLLLSGALLPERPVQLAEGLAIHPRMGCGTSHFQLYEIMVRPSSRLQLRAIDAHPNIRPDCPSQFRRRTLLEAAGSVAGFRPFLLTNGNFYHQGPIGFLWTKTSSGGSLLGQYRENGGDLFVADPSGGRILGATQLFHRGTSNNELLETLLQTYPNMTLATQVSTPLSERSRQAGRLRVQVPPYLHCADPGSVDWRCTRDSRLALCLKEDGSFSLLMTPALISVDRFAEGIRMGGSCGLECAQTFLLDGGMSTQLAYRDPFPGGALQMRYARPYRRTAVTGGCPNIRTVDHYFALGISQ